MSADIAARLKALKLHGMASNWPELVAHCRHAALEPEQLVEQLLNAEAADRNVRSIAYQMSAARFPAHRDLAGFDFVSSAVDETLVRQLHTTQFTEAAHNVVFIGGPGTGKTHLATALGVEAVQRHGKRVRFHSTVELVNALEQEKAAGKAGQIAHRLMYVSRRAGLPAVQPGGRCAAVPPAEQALRAHQRRDHDQPELQGMGERLRRRQDHGLARPAHAPLPHRRERQRVLALQAQQLDGRFNAWPHGHSEKERNLRPQEPRDIHRTGHHRVAFRGGSDLDERPGSVPGERQQPAFPSLTQSRHDLPQSLASAMRQCASAVPPGTKRDLSR